MKRRALLLAFLVALFLSGCSTPEYGVVEAAPVYGLDGSSLVEGTSEVIVAYLSTDQIEGGPQLTPVDDIRSDDPTIVRLAFTTHEFEVDYNVSMRGIVVYAVKPGTTNLRLYNGDDDVGALPITVVAVGH